MVLHLVDRERPDMDTPTSQQTPGDYALISESVDGAEILHVLGDLDLVSAPDFESKMVSGVRIGKRLVVDLTRCAYIDSSALGALVRAQRVVGKRLRVVIREGTSVSRVFNITAMAKYFPVLYSLEDAMAENTDSQESGGSAAS
jgi:anti-sigma B factor antagonist